jgi:hypothetical protein
MEPTAVKPEETEEEKEAREKAEAAKEIADIEKEMEDLKNDQLWLFYLVAGAILLVTYGFYWWMAAYYSNDNREDYGYDGLAAAFNGLAFAGLFYAIHLQRKELRAQRLELRLTRNELKRSADAQSESADFLKRQLEIQQKEFDRSRKLMLPRFGVSASRQKLHIVGGKHVEAIIVTVNNVGNQVNVFGVASVTGVTGIWKLSSFDKGATHTFNLKISEDGIYRFWFSYELIDGTRMKDEYFYDESKRIRGVESVAHDVAG